MTECLVIVGMMIVSYYVSYNVSYYVLYNVSFYVSFYVSYNVSYNGSYYVKSKSRLRDMLCRFKPRTVALWLRIQSMYSDAEIKYRIGITKATKNMGPDMIIRNMNIITKPRTLRSYIYDVCLAFEY